MQLTNLKTKYLGRNYNYYEQIDSTQSEIFRLIEQNKIQINNIESVLMKYRKND